MTLTQLIICGLIKTWYNSFMDLPDLPKTHKKQEANSSLKLREWIKKNPRQTCSIEMKDTRGKNYLNYSEVDDKQITYAKLISSDKGVLIRVQGLNGEPDYLWVRNQPAYIVIKYPKSTEWITIENFLYEKDKYKKKSLTHDRAVSISSLSF